MPDKRTITMSVREVALMGMMVGLLEAVKRALDFLPNVEMITLLMILYAVYFGRRTYLAALAFTVLETFIWGIHVWVIMYLYIWPLLITVVLKMRGKGPWWRYCIVSAVFGLCFGALCSVPYLFIGGPRMMFTWWVAGIPYDIVHCISNFLLCFVLFRPLSKAAARITKQDDGFSAWE